MADSQASTGQKDKSGKLKESIEVYNEPEAIKEGKDVKDESLEKFKNTQTSKNLDKALIKEINIGKETIGLPINQKFLSRIYSEQVNVDVSTQKFEAKFEEYSGEYFPGIKFQSIPESRKDFYKQSLGIIIASHESSIINLNPDDTKELCNLLLPLVSKSQETINQNTIEDTEEIEESISFANDPAGPLFIHLRAEGIISEEEFDILNEEYKTKQSFENIDVAEHSETIQQYLKQVIGTEQSTIENNKKGFLDDFNDTKVGIAEIDIEDDTTAKLIAESYVQIKKPGEDAHDKWKDYGTAVKTAKNKLLLGDYTVDRESETFKQAIRYIDSGVPINQYVGLQTIIALKGMAPGKFANVEKQNKKTRLTQLLEKSLKNDEQDRKNRKTSNKINAQMESKEKEEDGDPSEILNDWQFSNEDIAPLKGGDKEFETFDNNSSEIQK